MPNWKDKLIQGTAQIGRYINGVVCIFCIALLSLNVGMYFIQNQKVKVLTSTTVTITLIEKSPDETYVYYVHTQGTVQDKTIYFAFYTNDDSLNKGDTIKVYYGDRDLVYASAEFPNPSIYFSHRHMVLEMIRALLFVVLSLSWYGFAVRSKKVAWFSWLVGPAFVAIQGTDLWHKYHQL